jgi:hypothetical protein
MDAPVTEKRRPSTKLAWLIIISATMLFISFAYLTIQDLNQLIRYIINDWNGPWYKLVINIIPLLCLFGSSLALIVTSTLCACNIIFEQRKYLRKESEYWLKVQQLELQIELLQRKTFERADLPLSDDNQR